MRRAFSRFRPMALVTSPVQSIIDTLSQLDSLYLTLTLNCSSKKHYDVYSGSRKTREELLSKIYKDFSGLKEGTIEWKRLADSRETWRKYHQPFDLTPGRQWQEKNHFTLDRIDRLSAQFPFTIQQFSDYLKVSLSSICQDRGIPTHEK